MESWKAMVLGTDAVILMLVLFAAPQERWSANAGAAILVVTCMTAILVFGIPSIKMQLTVKSEHALAIVLAIPYLAVFITGGSGIKQFPTFAIWYILPAILMWISGKLENSTLSSLSLIGGAAMLWIGFDHRYTRELFEGYSDSYLFNSLWMAAVGLVACQGRILTNHSFDNGIFPTKQGAKIANIVTPIASLIIVPFGLLTGFLEWNPQIEVTGIFIGFIGIFLTISLQEELIFRGITLRELDLMAHQTTNPNFWKRMSLITISILFALTHWNNETKQYVFHYFFAAFIAGVAYGIAYRKGGMFGAMLSHTLVDWVWALLLKRVE
ncbi:MAG: CPBP family intramembrane metalloprotease [Methanobacteriota archaeon]|nr:MAG: CPBP family intramembrane metalloprotease [Euryarchaeota archaeon]